MSLSLFKNCDNTKPDIGAIFKAYFAANQFLNKVFLTIMALVVTTVGPYNCFSARLFGDKLKNGRSLT